MNGEQMGLMKDSLRLDASLVPVFLSSMEHNVAVRHARKFHTGRHSRKFHTYLHRSQTICMLPRALNASQVEQSCHIGPDL